MIRIPATLCGLAAPALLLLAACHNSSLPGGIDRPAPPVTEPPAETEPPATEAPVGLWLGGDMHVHSDHSSDGSALRQLADDRGPGNVSVADQIGQAEQRVDWVTINDHRTYDQHYDPLWESDSLILIPGEEANGSPHATVQGAVDTVVQGAGRPDTPGFMNLQQSIWDTHSQGATWTTAHPDDGELNDDGTPNERASALGVDNVETWNRASDGETEIDYAENRWNAGFLFGIAGASDNHFRELWAVTPPGSPFTGVFAAEYSERGILQGLQAGRSSIGPSTLEPFATIEADLNGDGIYEAIGGDEAIAAPGTAGRLRVRVLRGLGTTALVYRSPGRSAGEFASFTPIGLDNTFEVDIVAEEQPTWYRVELRGPGVPATVNTATLQALGDSPQALPGILAQLSMDVVNALRGMTAPVFIAPAPIQPQPEIPLPADSGVNDGAQLALGARKRYAGFPDIARDGSAMHVVAEVHGDAATRIEYRRLDGSSVTLSGDSRAARFPRIVARGNDVWVTWQDERAGQMPRRGAIYLRHSADGGRSWQPEQLVRAIEGRCERPVIALTADGLPVLAWQEISADNPFDVMLQIIGRDDAPQNLSREGKTVNPALITDTRSARYPASVWPSLAAAPDGTVSVAWQDNRTDIDPLWTGSFPGGEGTDPDNWQIMVRSLPPGTSTWSAPSSIGSDELADRHPAIAYTADNRLVAAWDSKELRSSGANLAVLSALSTDRGASWGEPAAIAPVEHGMSQYPKLGRDGDGVRAVWYDSRSLDWRWRVMTAKLSGSNWAGTQLIPSRGINTWPATDGGAIAFASTRNAQRMQRDKTQQVFVLMAP